jgi:hypothetical protein
MICSENIRHNFDKLGTSYVSYVSYSSNTANWQNGVFTIDNNKPQCIYKWLINKDSAYVSYNIIINEPPPEIKKRAFHKKVRLITKLGKK